MCRAAPATDHHGYKIIYSGIFEAAGKDRICLIPLVGAARFELATPCAQGGLRPPPRMPCFQALTFQADTGSRLKPVEPG